MPSVIPRDALVQIANKDALLDAMADVARAFGMRSRPLSTTSSEHFAPTLPFFPRHATSAEPVIGLPAFAGAPFPSFLAAMARTGVLVSRHGPLLANGMFLSPGAALRTDTVCMRQQASPSNSPDCS